MKRYNKSFIFIIGFLCAWILFSISLQKAIGSAAIPANVSFSGDGNGMYFFDRDNAKVYKYNVQGRLTRSYSIKELGRDLETR